jgi:hypothetical protein
MRVFMWVNFLVAVAFGGYTQEAYDDPYSCVRLKFEAGATAFPEKWYGGKIRAQAVSLAPSEKENVKKCMEMTFRKYPVALLCSNLESVYVLKSMKFYGVPYGGTSSGNRVYITDDEENLNCSYDLLENYFHHEFSSILLHNYSSDFSKRKWKKLNPKGFKYGKGGLQAIRNNAADMVFDSLLNKNGFLTKYSEASLEEDFNLYCQNIFNGGEEFWRLVDAFPAIRAKTELVIRFYNRINPVFTERYFRSLNR